jgi:hypothetical protein
MKVDKRTFIIVAIIVVIVLPIIFFVFRRTFIPLVASVGQQFKSAALMNSTTGLPVQLLPENVRKDVFGK